MQIHVSLSNSVQARVIQAANQNQQTDYQPFIFYLAYKQQEIHQFSS